MKLAAAIATMLIGCAREPAPPATAIASTAPASTAIVAMPASPPVVALADVRRRGHDALSCNCGECHESHRPTAKPPALAIFDLDAPDWLSRFDTRRFEVAVKRFSSKPPADRDAFVALRDAELAARQR